jgi:hypothetical protein
MEELGNSLWSNSVFKWATLAKLIHESSLTNQFLYVQKCHDTLVCFQCQQANEAKYHNLTYQTLSRVMPRCQLCILFGGVLWNINTDKINNTDKPHPPSKWDIKVELDMAVEHCPYSSWSNTDTKGKCNAMWNLISQKLELHKSIWDDRNKEVHGQLFQEKGEECHKRICQR